MCSANLALVRGRIGERVEIDKTGISNSSFLQKVIWGWLDELAVAILAMCVGRSPFHLIVSVAQLHGKSHAHTGKCTINHSSKNIPLPPFTGVYREEVRGQLLVHRPYLHPWHLATPLPSFSTLGFQQFSKIGAIYHHQRYGVHRIYVFVSEGREVKWIRCMY